MLFLKKYENKLEKKNFLHITILFKKHFLSLQNEISRKLRMSFSKSQESENIAGLQLEQLIEGKHAGD